MKLLFNDSNLNLRRFNDKSKFSIMFGPDYCNNLAKCHLIVGRYDADSSFRERHLKRPEIDDSLFKDQLTHLFTLS